MLNFNKHVGAIEICMICFLLLCGVLRQETGRRVIGIIHSGAPPVLWRRHAFTARMDDYLGKSNVEIGEFGVANVWFQCCEKGYFEK